MNFKIRKAQKEDMPQVLKLIQELAVYEKEPDAVEVDVQNLEQYGFGKEAIFRCYVAEVNTQIIGMALFYYRYSTWKGKTIHLEDLIVNKKYRGKGVGMALYKKVMAAAKSERIKRVEWAVLDWNQPAIEFYEKTGADVMRDWDTVQFSQKAYLKFLGEGN